MQKRRKNGILDGMKTTTTWTACITGLAALAWGAVASWGGENGYVQVWGSSENGLQTVPTAVLSNATSLAAGWYHCLALAEGGRVYAWGSNEGSQTNVPPNAQAEVTAIAAGAQSSAAIRNGRIILWGNPNNISNKVEFTETVPDNGPYKAVALGANHGLALREEDGRVEGWGNDSVDQTSGPGRDWGDGITAIAVGNEFSMGLNENGKVFVSGHPLNVNNQSLRVDEIPAEAGSGVTAIAAGPYHAMALKDGGVLVWGAWIADRSTSGRGTPKAAYGGVTNVPDSAKSGVVAIAAGQNVCAALKEDGSLVIWGNELASGSVHNIHTIPLCAARDVKEIALGLRHAMARTSYLPPAFTTDSLPDGYVESPYESSISALGDPAPSFSLGDSRSLPAGLSLDRETGAITGIPEVVKSNNVFLVVVSNAYGIAKKEFNIAVNPRKAQVPTWETESLPPAVIGTWYEEQLRATESPSYSIDATLDPLPGWATLSTSGILSGWPIGEGSSFPTFIATNEAGAATRRMELATVNPTTVPRIGGEGALPDGVNGSVYCASNTIQLPGGGIAFGCPLDITGASSVSPIEGSLPVGLELRGTNGMWWIAGTPTKTGQEATFVLEAVNTAGSASGTWSIAVKGKPEWVTPVGALPEGAVGVPYRAEVVARWATGYRVVSGTLPAGLTMGMEEGETGMAGVISGTPAAATEGEAVLEVKASNDYGETASRRFTLVISDKVPAELWLTGIEVLNGTATLTWTNKTGEKTEAWVGYTDDLNEGWPTNGTPSSLGWVKTNSPAKLSGGPGPRFYMLQPAD